MHQARTIDFVNHGALASLLDVVVRDFEPIQKILLLSPHQGDKYFAKKLFPRALTFISDVYVWNLNGPPPRGLPRVDLAISSNVLMYAANPETWIRNVLSVANLYVFQDIKYRKRSPGEPWLGADGDKMRYTLNPENTKQPSVALSRMPFKIHKFFEYEGIKNAHHEDRDPPIHICAALSDRKHDQTPASLTDLYFSIKQRLMIRARKNMDRVSRRVFRYWGSDN